MSDPAYLELLKKQIHTAQERHAYALANLDAAVCLLKSRQVDCFAAQHAYIVELEKEMSTDREVGSKIKCQYCDAGKSGYRTVAGHEGQCEYCGGTGRIWLTR